MLSIRSDLTDVTQLSSLISKAIELLLTVKRVLGCCEEHVDKSEISSKINCNQHFKIIVIVFVAKVPLLITVLRTRWCKTREALVNKTRLKRVKVSTRLESALKIIDTI